MHSTTPDRPHDIDGLPYRLDFTLTSTECEDNGEPLFRQSSTEYNRSELNPANLYQFRHVTTAALKISLGHNPPPTAPCILSLTFTSNTPGDDKPLILDVSAGYQGHELTADTLDHFSYTATEALTSILRDRGLLHQD